MLLQEEPLLLQEAQPGGTGEIRPTVIGAIMRVPEHNLIRINRHICRSLVAVAEVMINFSLITQL